MKIYVTKLLACFGFIINLVAMSGCDLYFGPPQLLTIDAAAIIDAEEIFDCPGIDCQTNQDCLDTGQGNLCQDHRCYTSECFDPLGGRCRVTCGDGILEPVRGEQCDDGNKIDSDACNNMCQLTLASCAGEVTCAVLPPTCTAQEVPLLSNGCYTGQCRLITACDVPPACATIRNEAACSARAECQAAYTGMNCRHQDGSACRAGDMQCVCESFAFAACATRN